MHQALHRKRFEAVPRLNPCCGLRPWQLLGFDLQVAFASPIYGSSAKINCSARLGT